MSLSHFHIWLRVGTTSIGVYIVHVRIGRPLSRRCLRIWCAEFATTQLLDLNSLGWPVCSTCTRLVPARSRAGAPPTNLTFDLRLDKITRRI